MRGIVTGSRFAAAMCVVALLLPSGSWAAPPANASTPAPAPASGQDFGVTDGEQNLQGLAVGVDLLVVRPLGVVATAVGFVFFVPAAVLSLPGYPDSLRESWGLFVRDPAEDVYKRSLGDL